MGKIQVLDKSVSNKIAAGEVVERPASVVKELLENALDAGASHIVTEIKNGGITYIRVTDNGHGMSREDVPVALLRHATSKIAAAADLDAITTLGFRGEALSSIAAVAKLEIYTRTPEEETGTHLLAEDGEIIECSEAGCPAGTTVVVRDLFMTTPARKKFLKKNYTEAGYIGDIVNRLALARPEVSFRLIADGKELLFTAGDNNLLNSIFAVYGKDLKNTMRPAFYEEGGISVSGFCATGAGARPNRSMQSFFVSGRYIKSPLLAHAVEEAYKNEVMGGKFPACVLFLNLSPTMVDINVHPTKLEAKFADEKMIYHCVYWAAKNALYQKNEIPAVTLTAGEDEPATQVGKSESENPIRLRPSIQPSVVMREPPVTLQKPVFTAPVRIVRAEENQTEINSVADRPMSVPEQKAVPIPLRVEAAASDETVSVQAEQKEIEPTQQRIEYRICGRVFDTYILVEKDDQLLLVDQHAAHERLRYEELLKQFSGKKIQSQMLLIPVTVRLTADEEGYFYEYEEMLSELGFIAEDFGDKAVILRGAPEALDEKGLQSLFLEVLGHLGERRKDARSSAAQRALYTIACKSAVKAGNKLEEPEIRALLDAVFSLDSINTCPHGRPITVAMTRTFIEKQFKRIV